MSKKIRFEESGIRKAVGPLWKGFQRVLSGATVAFLIGVAWACFDKVPEHSGYMAVLGFMLGAVVLAFALSCMWFIGGGEKRTGAFDK